MENQIDWMKECEKIATKLVEDVCRQFANNDEIKLDMCRPISCGVVHGLFEQEYLNDEYNTVIITYSVIDRKDIVLKKEDLHKAAADMMDDILKHPDWQVITDADDFRIFLRNRAEWAVGNELQRIFSETACANPDKYPKYKTHGHAVKK